jgi:hypothetical protein
MTLTLHLSTATEAGLSAESIRTGKSPESLALEAVEEKFSTAEAVCDSLPLDEWQARFHALLATMPRGNPDADFSRDLIYEGRGE